MPGIWAAVKATTFVESSWRNTVLKLWKSRPPAPEIDYTTLCIGHGPILHPP